VGSAINRGVVLALAAAVAATVLLGPAELTECVERCNTPLVERVSQPREPPA
jgi:hypothetical protein